MTIFYLGHHITLHVDVWFAPSPASAQQLKKFAQAQSISTLFHLTLISTHPQHSSSPLHPFDQHTPRKSSSSSFNSRTSSTNPVTFILPVPSNTIFILSQTLFLSMSNHTGTPISRKLNLRSKSPPCSRLDWFIPAISHFLHRYSSSRIRMEVGAVM